MTLLAMNSFDGPGLDPNMIGDSYLLDTTTKRTGIAALRLSTANQRYYNVTPSGKIIFGVAVYLTTITLGYPKILLYGDGGATAHVAIGVDQATSKWQARRGVTTGSMTNGTALATDTGAAAQASRWYYVEGEITIDDTTGICNVWVDGVQVIAFTGDTRNGGTSTNIDRVAVQGDAGGNNAWFDDLYILNDQGSVNNLRLGDVDVYFLRPNGAGDTSNLTPSTGSNYQNVDEAGTPNTADYNSATSSTLRDLYALDDLPSNVAAVQGARVVWYGKKAAVGKAGFKPVTKANGATKTDETEQALGLTDSMFVGAIQELDPSGVAWSASVVNAAQAGVETT